MVGKKALAHYKNESFVLHNPKYCNDEPGFYLDVSPKESSPMGSRWKKVIGG
jgi:hypothetical protein